MIIPLTAVFFGYHKGSVFDLGGVFDLDSLIKLDPALFVGGFFKTAYKIGKPFVVYCVIAFTIMSISEIIHHFPGLEAVNAFGFEHATLQLSLLLCGAILYTVMTYLSYKKACRDFDKIDL